MADQARNDLSKAKPRPKGRFLVNPLVASSPPPAAGGASLAATSSAASAQGERPWRGFGALDGAVRSRVQLPGNVLCEIGVSASAQGAERPWRGLGALDGGVRIRVLSGLQKRVGPIHVQICLDLASAAQLSGAEDSLELEARGGRQIQTDLDALEHTAHCGNSGRDNYTNQSQQQLAA